MFVFAQHTNVWLKCSLCSSNIGWKWDWQWHLTIFSPFSSMFAGGGWNDWWMNLKMWLFWCWIQQQFNVFFVLLTIVLFLKQISVRIKCGKYLRLTEHCSTRYLGTVSTISQTVETRFGIAGNMPRFQRRNSNFIRNKWAFKSNVDGCQAYQPSKVR